MKKLASIDLGSTEKTIVLVVTLLSLAYDLYTSFTDDSDEDE